MRTALALVVACLIGTALAGCQTAAVPGAEVTPDGTVIFAGQGSSVIVKPDDPLAVLEARAAAKTMALADLVAKVKGAMVHDSVEVGDMVFTGQTAAMHAEGMVARAAVYYEAEEGEHDARIVRALAVLELPRRELERLREYVE
jgi:hypothetical protein